MSWAAQLLRYTAADQVAPATRLAGQLAAVQLALSANARALAENAEMAPHEAGELALRDLAGREEQLADRIRGILFDLGGPVPLLQAVPPQGPPEVSYWARLSEDLSRHIETERRLRELAVAAVELSSALAAQLRAAADAAADHSRRLRNLISCADPHALD